MNYIIKELSIDKTSYSIQDQIKGYTLFSINPIQCKSDRENLKLLLEFAGQYDTSSPDYEYGNHTFIYQKHLLKEIQNLQENQIQEEAFSFQYDLDLITTSGYQQNKYPSIKYYIKAIIIENDVQVCDKEIVFSIYRQFPSLIRLIKEQISLPVQSIFCCTYGQISAKIEIDKTDFQINDIAYIKIELDLRLTSINISQMDIFLISEDFQEVTNFVYAQMYQKITCNIQQGNQLYHIEQQLPIKCSDNQYKEFYTSTECSGFCHKYFIKFKIIFGCLIQPIVIQLPIILYQTQMEHLKLFMKHQIIYNSEFNSVYFEQNKAQCKFIQNKVTQKKWNNTLINFQKIDNYQSLDLKKDNIKINE